MSLRVCVCVTSNAGCFPKPLLINFTFLGGLLAERADACSSYVNRGKMGQGGCLFGNPVMMMLTSPVDRRMGWACSSTSEGLIALYFRMHVLLPKDGVAYKR